MGLKRRDLLQRTALLLSALGLSEASLAGWAERYQQALAQPTRRKLALLVGVNQYPAAVCDSTSDQALALRGSLTDVQLQRELLVSRYGFQPADIVTLSDQQATRQGIVSAFQSHLIDQAQPGDVAVFHFSGYGSRFRLASEPKLVQNSLVPVDGYLPTEANPQIQDLTEEALKLLIGAVKTRQFTSVIDAGFLDIGRLLWGNLRVRSRPNAPTGELSLDLQRLQETLGFSGKANRENEANGSKELPGTVLAAAAPHQLALEGRWQGFDAGIFTYALTQHLWELQPAQTLQFVLSRTAETMHQWTGLEQQPQIRGQQSEETTTVYNLKPEAATAAEGVISGTDDGRSFTVWLGGLPATALEHYGVNSLLSLASTPNALETGLQPAADIKLKVQSRNGLTAQVAPLESQTGMIQAGQRVYESLRMLSRNVPLLVALDNSLERIERVDATSALSGISFVSSVSPGEQPADCLFGRLLTASGSTLTASLLSQGERGGVAPLKDTLPSKGGYGLFSPSRELVPGTVVKPEEAIKTALGRLTPQLEAILAAKLLRLTENQGASRLPVRANLEMMEPQERILALRETTRSPEPLPKSRLAPLFTRGERTIKVPTGSRIRYRLANFGDRPLYFTMISFDGQGRALALFPKASTVNQASDALLEAVLENNELPPNDVRFIPQAGTDWIADVTSDWIETHIILSVKPLSQMFNLLAEEAKSAGNSGRVNPLPEPLKAARYILSDLDRASATTLSDSNSPVDTYALDMNAWATLSFVYQVV
ncbi:MAG: caspase family protein [Leptolyngbyaceae cyanobacterium SM1_1_3]|nr:caspase family protein [Leptolyngbyaceae cyanobacterium SM1_1_3]NJN02436.1 caspase family protein [Leptolyngbyaceae cyanobacterium RM1_1_2]NJO10472.1 caspase family protein [Leptolyngbyaceae cyanobacterium SL_1_1]